MFKLKYILLTLLVAFSLSSIAQTKEEIKDQLYPYAVKLQSEGKYDDALTVFKNLLRTDSNNLEYLHHTAFLYAKAGIDQPNFKLKSEWLNTAEYLSLKAIQLKPTSADAHYTYALSIAGKNEYASNRAKIANAKLIKTEAETAIKLNPRLAGPYHILGRWNQAIAGFNSLERGMIKALFGGLPLGTYDAAIENFEKAIQLDPLNGWHYYQLAVSYNLRNETGDKAQAKNWLSKELLIPIRNKDDANCRKDSEALLKKLN